MNKELFNSLLVPTDFTDNSWSAFEHALRLIGGDEAEIVVVHVIDTAFIRQVEQLGMGGYDEINSLIRDKANESLIRYSESSRDNVNVDTLVCEGAPFVEIIRKAGDFAVDAIVMSKLGQRGQADTLLFGSTAEKVARGSKIPVIVLPIGKS